MSTLASGRADPRDDLEDRPHRGRAGDQLAAALSVRAQGAVLGLQALPLPQARDQLDLRAQDR